MLILIKKAMKKNIISALFLCAAWTSYSQVSIGVPLPDKSAVLDLKSDNKGLLIPRVILTGDTEQTKFGGVLTVEGQLTESLLVYHMGSTGLPTKGFYYWKTGLTPEEGKWVLLNDGSNTTALIETLTELGLEEATVQYPNVKGIDEALTAPVLTYLDETKTLNKIQLLEALKKAETVTLLEKDKVLMYKYLRTYDDNGVTKTVEGYTPDKSKYDGNTEYFFTDETKEVPAYSYYNEKGTKVTFNGAELVTPASETLTSLNYQSTGNQLIYKDELGAENIISLKELVSGAETITKLELVTSGDSGVSGVVPPYLKYTNEAKLNPDTYIPLKDLTLSAWNDVATHNQASSVDQQVYTNKWVGIGYKEPSASIGTTNEKLRVNGSIAATDSYYADYVFEDYFDGSSTIKEEYSFKSLDEVERFITANRHLPGITPITELEKTDTGYSFNVSELSIQLLEKTEELYLHVLEQNKQLKAKEEQLQLMNQLILDLQKSLLEVKEQIKYSIK